MHTVIRCSGCGKAIEIQEAVMGGGKFFCSEECKKNSYEKTI